MKTRRRGETTANPNHRRRNQRRRRLHDRRAPPPTYADELRTTITDIDFERSRRSRPPPPLPYADEGYSGNYGNPEAGYAANPYQASYGGNPMNPAGAENYPPYGPGLGSWGAYNMQRAQGKR
ncbi:hypothetical protein RHGRI_008842 [Rhododendron griersonianum]|uniref:Uncharacterized protein n=1 Tax=Rhododendron griersonianum TaxID=479676 RepID=A0AAV6L2C8_9ERIC|nr:hypothetical protein RHGRI_008842 [Rhododendron griersonianum]